MEVKLTNVACSCIQTTCGLAGTFKSIQIKREIELTRVDCSAILAEKLFGFDFVITSEILATLYCFKLSRFHSLVVTVRLRDIH